MENLLTEFLLWIIHSLWYARLYCELQIWIYKWSAPLMFQLRRIYCGVTWRIWAVWEEQQQQCSPVNQMDDFKIISSY